MFIAMWACFSFLLVKFVFLCKVCIVLNLALKLTGFAQFVKKLLYNNDRSSITLYQVFFGYNILFLVKKLNLREYIN